MSTNMIAGPIAGITCCCIFYPIDTIKTRLQSPEYRALVLKDGAVRFRGLYQGIGPVLIAALPASATFFTSYQGSKRFLNNNTSSIPAPLINCAASTFAELTATAVGAPAEVIKQNAQVLKSSNGSTSLQAIRLIGRNPRNFWRGYTLLAGRNLPFIALQFPLYEELKIVLGAEKAQDDWWEMSKITAIAAGVSGGLAAWITTPIDVVKTRIMLSATEKGKKVGPKEVFKKILKEEGVKELFRGGGMRLFWTIIGSGMYLAIYEGMSTWLGRTTDI